MKYKMITIEITMGVPVTDCFAIDELADELDPILEQYGTVADVRYHDNVIE